MDLSHIPMDAEGIKKFKQEMHEAGIDEIEIGFPPPGSYEHPAFALPYVKSIKYRNTNPITDKPVTEKVTHFRQVKISVYMFRPFLISSEITRDGLPIDR